MTYKCNWSGKNLLKIGRFEPSSQTCSSCGIKNGQVKDLAIRNWKCPSCGVIHDRDINAAKNILRFALNNHTGWEPPSEPVELISDLGKTKQSALKQEASNYTLMG